MSPRDIQIKLTQTVLSAYGTNNEVPMADQARAAKKAWGEVMGGQTETVKDLLKTYYKHLAETPVTAAKLRALCRD